MLCFTLLNQLIHSISQNDAIAWHLFIVIGCLCFLSHDCESHDGWHSHMTYRYESWVPRMWSTSETWLAMSYYWFKVCCGVDTYTAADAFHTISHFEPWVIWRGSLSHFWGKHPYIRVPSEHEFGFFTYPSKLHSLLLSSTYYLYGYQSSMTRVASPIVSRLIRYQ